MTRLATEENIEIQSITKELIRAEDTDDETIFDTLETEIQKNKKVSQVKHLPNQKPRS